MIPYFVVLFVSGASAALAFRTPDKRNSTLFFFGGYSCALLAGGIQRSHRRSGCPNLCGAVVLFCYLSEYMGVYSEFG